MIFGIWSRDRRSIPSPWVDALEARARAWPSDAKAHFDLPGCYIAIHERTLVNGANPTSFALSDDGLSCLVIDGRIDNRIDLQNGLGLPDVSDAKLALAAFRRWGRKCTSHLIGEFALAVVHDNGSAVEVARDSMGTRPLFTAESSDYFAFASSMDVLLALPFVDRGQNTTWVSDFLELIKPDASSTPYIGINALAPAEQITMGSGYKLRETFWVPPRVDSALDISEAEAVAEYRRLFEQAVACRLPNSGVIGCELSGGLDSTSIAVTAAPMMVSRGGTTLTMSHVMGVPTPGGMHLLDERREVEAVLAVMPPGEHRWLSESLAPQLEAMKDTIIRHGGLQRRDFNSVQHGVAEAMRGSDCRILLSGFGGDQLATSFGAGLKETLAEDHQWTDLALMTKSFAERLAWRTSAGRYLLRRRARLNFETRCRGTPRITRSDWMSDNQLAGRRIAFPTRPYWGTIGARERQVICSPHVGHRGQDSAVGAGSQGFVYSYPMLDLRLVDFCMRLPDRLKRDAGSPGRRLIRSAMEGRLPDNVRLRDDKSPAAVPLAVARFFAEAVELANLFERHRRDPNLTRFIDMDWALYEIRELAEHGDKSRKLGVRQFRRLAEVCLWHEWLEENQANHAE